MSAPLINSAGDSTPGRLGCADINMGSVLALNWAPIQYIESYDFPKDTGGFVDATVFGDGGYTGQDKLSTTWALTLILNHMIVPGTNPPIYDPTHDYLEAHAVGVLGAANRVQLRMYDFDENDVTGVVTPRGQAYTGFANYDWPGFGATAQGDARKITVAFMGKGKLTPVSHPYALTPAVPTIGTFAGNPLAAGGGTAFKITGQGFVGTTAVTIGGTAVTSFKVWDDTLITGVSAAHAAGTGLPVVVTNAVGASTTGATRATYV